MPRSQRLGLLALVLAVSVLVLHARVVLGGMTWNDVRYHTEIAPPRIAASEAVLAGEAPTWWEGTTLGVPLLGEPSHGAAYPLTWLAASPHVLDLLAILQLFWLALGVVIWARRLGASELASVVAGVLVAASGIATSAALRGALPALANVPWVGWAALSLATAQTAPHARRAAALLGVLLGMIGLAGQLGILVDALVLALALGMRRETARWLAMAIAGGLAISAAQWIPALAIVGDGAGGTMGPLKPSRLLELLLPGSFGASGGGRAVTEIAGAAAQLPSLYIGAPLFALAALAQPSRRVIGGAAFAGVLALVVGRGGSWPSYLGAPELHLAVLAMIAAPHATTGLDALFARERRALITLGGALVVTGLALGALAALRSRTDNAAVERALLDGGLAVGCLIAALAIAWRTRISAPLGDEPPTLAWSTLAIAALVVAPSVGSLGSTAPVIERDIIDTPPLWVDAALAIKDPTNPRLPLRVYRPISLYEEQENGLADAIATLTGTAAARYGLGTARSEDPARPLVHDRVWLAASSFGGALLDRYSIPLAVLPGSMVGFRGLVEVARRGQSGLVRYPAAPAAVMVFEWFWIPDDAAAIARLFPPGTGGGLTTGIVILEGTGSEQQEEPRTPEPCTVNRWARGAIDMTCAGTDPAYAVVSSTTARGWTVEVDGKDTPWVTADVMRRAVALSAGAHVVSWRYEAPGLPLGFALALTAFIGLLGLGLHAHLRARRLEPTSDDADDN